jgi:hypothetical protein
MMVEKMVALTVVMKVGMMAEMRVALMVVTMVERRVGSTAGLS